MATKDDIRLILDGIGAAAKRMGMFDPRFEDNEKTPLHVAIYLLNLNPSDFSGQI